jgi:hypothetical protein
MPKITRKTAIEAHCWQCLGFYADGKQDCQNPRCPLYEFMPYRRGEPDPWWQEFSHKRAGKIPVAEATRVLTPEARAAATARLAAARIARKESDE